MKERSFSRFLMHYDLSDGSHSLDAFALNKSDAELLAIFKEVSETLGITVSIESESINDGGLREKWKLIHDNAWVLSLIVAIIALILSRYPPRNATLERLTTKDYELSIIERELHIKQLRKELAQSSENPSKDLTQKVTEHLSQSHSINIHRSNFYKHAQDSLKVKQIDISTSTNGITSPEITIIRQDFAKFFVSTNPIPVETNPSATIEIVAPVLKRGKYRWKGIYNKKPIEFSLTDEQFASSVYSRLVKFKSGYTIKCVLDIERNINESGEISITRYSTPIVIGSIEDGELTLTDQGALFIKTNKESYIESNFDVTQVSSIQPELF